METIYLHDASPEKLSSWFGDPRVVPASRLEDLLEDASVRTVFIATPNATHKELAIRSLAAGKAVMCEKPMATTLADAQEMVATAEACQGFLQIGFELRYSKLFTTIKHWIDRGLLGTVVNTNCQYVSSEYWGKHSWRVRRTSGGGMFGEKLSHYVDLPRWWIGDKVTSVYSVCAPNNIPYYEIRDNFHTTYKFAQGAVSLLSFTMGAASTFRGDPLQNAVSLQQDGGHELRYLIVGTKGSAVADVFRRKIKRWDFHDTKDMRETTLAEELTWPEEEDDAYFHNTAAQTNDIVDRVQRNLPPMTSARDALETMKLAFAAELSADTGCLINPDEMHAQTERYPLDDNFSIFDQQGFQETC